MKARTATILATALCAAWGGLIAAPREGAPLPASHPAAPARAPAAFPQAASVPPVAVDGALVQRYCVGCHNARLQTGGLDLQSLDLADLASHADVWEKVVRKVARNMMPPAGAPRPDAETLSAFVVALETALDRSAPSYPPADPPLLHRFNRVEYANAIRDLLALEVDAAALLPPDDSSFGFDNIAAVLGMSPLLMERYVSAAERISALAVGDPEVPVAAQVYRLAMDDTQNDRMPGLPLGTRGGTTVRHTFPVGGEYLIRVKLWKTSVGFVKGLQTEHQVEVSVDGRQVLLAPVGGRSDYQMNVLTSGAGVEKVLDARLRRRMEVEAGPHDVTVTFLAIAGGTRTGPEGLRPTMFAQDPLYIQGMPAIESFIIEGPYDANGAGGATTTPSRQAIFSCRPASAADEDTCARSILARLARQAYRRPVTEADLEVLLGLYRDGRGDGDFERGIQLALEGILTSPYFLFRAQQQSPGAQAAAAPAGAFEVASRLSFFLWSSLPDERLLELASAGTLNQPAILEQEVRRMLADPKAAALIDNFGGQWLHLRNLDALVPDRVEFPEFNGHIKDAMRRETELFLDSVLRGDRSVLDLLDADYTFVNEPLARHYGLSGVYGQEFRRVPVQDPARRGLLGHASILAVTSFPSRTSPVNRGRFVLENF
ncbi:MAG: DUF1592 domain-containing protein, partial [Acidobacteria bacterium]|nr:DUF1592 domain-containing protein [Acidobacteriota bacterium]